MVDEADKATNEVENKVSQDAGVVEKPASEPAPNDNTAAESSSKNPPPSTTDSTEKKEEEEPPKMSKNQLKKKRKWEKAMELKRKKKEQEKKVKRAKAEAEGRDIEKEQEEMERRRKDGSGWARRIEWWKEMFQKQSCKYQIYLDCSFEQEMMKSEVNSLANQIRYCYATNKKSKTPVKATVCSLGGKTREILDKVTGIDQWANREFHLTEKDIIEVTDDKSKLVYLTSDSPNTLTELEDGKTYIIGGIVDRNRLKRIAIDKAEKLGVQTAKLPIDEHLKMFSTKVLTCNHVFDILLKWKQCDGDWQKTLLDVLPKKKDATEKESK